MHHSQHSEDRNRKILNVTGSVGHRHISYSLAVLHISVKNRLLDVSRTNCAPKLTPQNLSRRSVVFTFSKVHTSCIHTFALKPSGSNSIHDLTMNFDSVKLRRMLS